MLLKCLLVYELVARRGGVPVLLLLILLSLCPVPGSVAQETSAKSLHSGSSPIGIQTTSSTWMFRGRNLVNIGSIIRNKLTDAGLVIAPSSEKTPVYSLLVDYREDRGSQYSIDSYGTNITCSIRLQHASEGTLMTLVVQEDSGEQTFGTPPYVVAIQNFQTNPYIYFLGDIIKGTVQEGQDVTEGLLQGLEKSLKSKPVAFDPLSAPHTMMAVESTYSTRARNNTIVELGRLKAVRSLPLLVDFLDHSDSTVRRLSVKALGDIGSPKARNALQKIAQSDRNSEVRKEARSALAGLGS